MLEMRVDPQVEDVIYFFVEHGFRQAKRRDLAEHKAAALELLVKQMDLVTERRQIACDGQRSGPGADQRDLFAVRRKRRLRHKVLDLAFIVGGHAF